MSQYDCVLCHNGRGHLDDPRISREPRCAKGRQLAGCLCPHARPDVRTQLREPALAGDVQYGSGGAVRHARSRIGSIHPTRHPRPWPLQATHPALLEKLAAALADSDYNVRDFLRLLVKSNAYQLSSLATAQNAADRNALIEDLAWVAINRAEFLFSY